MPKVITRPWLADKEIEAMRKWDGQPEVKELCNPDGSLLCRCLKHDEDDRMGRPRWVVEVYGEDGLEQGYRWLSKEQKTFVERRRQLFWDAYVADFRDVNEPLIYPRPVKPTTLLFVPGREDKVSHHDSPYSHFGVIYGSYSTLAYGYTVQIKRIGLNLMFSNPELYHEFLRTAVVNLVIGETYWFPVPASAFFFPEQKEEVPEDVPVSMVYGAVSGFVEHEAVVPQRQSCRVEVHTNGRWPRKPGRLYEMLRQGEEDQLDDWYAMIMVILDCEERRDIY